MSTLSFIVYCPAGRFDSALASSPAAEILGRIERPTELAEAVERKRPQALLLSLDPDPQRVFEVVEKLAAPRPLLFFHGPDESRLVVQAMRLGGREYVTPSADAEGQLLAAVLRAAQETQREPVTRGAASIALLGSKGGVGTSFVACQLAAALARANGRVALVDGRRYHGDLALYMDLEPKYDFASLVAGDDPIDSTYLHSALLPHKSGVVVLAGPKEPEDAERVDAKCVASVQGLLHDEFEWVVWDVSDAFEARNLYLLDRVDHLVLVTTPDVPALSHTRMLLDSLGRLGLRPSDIRIVVNGGGKGSAVSEKETNEFLKREVDATIPYDYPRASACVNEGRTLLEVGEGSPMDRAFSNLARLAHEWSGRTVPESPKRGLLNRLRGR